MKFPLLQHNHTYPQLSYIFTFFQNGRHQAQCECCHCCSCHHRWGDQHHLVLWHLPSSWRKILHQRYLGWHWPRFHYAAYYSVRKLLRLPPSLCIHMPSIFCMAYVQKYSKVKWLISKVKHLHTFIKLQSTLWLFSIWWKHAYQYVFIKCNGSFCFFLSSGSQICTVCG